MAENNVVTLTPTLSLRERGLMSCQSANSPKNEKTLEPVVELALPGCDGGSTIRVAATDQ